MIPIRAMMGLWLIWLVSWWVAAFWSVRAVKGPGATPQIAYNLLTVATPTMRKWRVCRCWFR